MGAVWTLALDVLLGLGAYWVARYGFRQPAGPPRWLASATLAWAWATVGMEVLGTLGMLARGPLLLWTASGVGVGLVLRRLGRREGEDIGATGPAGGPWEWEAVVALGLTVWTAMTLGTTSLLMAVKVFSDGPIYHLYFAARWWQEGRLFLVAAPFGETAAPYFPANGDLWFSWLMTSWGGDRLAKVGQAPFLLMAAVAAFAMARRLGAGPSASLIATCWFASLTPVMLWSFEPNVDTIFAAGYLTAALFFLLYALGDGGAGTLALGGLAAGGALGTKTVGVVFVPPLLGLAVVAALARPGPVARKAGHALLVLASPLVTAGFWYGRDLILTGNPLYPLQVTAFGRVWLPGWYGPGAMKFSPYYISVREWRALVDILLMMYDPRLVPVWVAALSGAWAVGRSRTDLDRWAWACAGLAVLNVALYWLFIPYRSQQRFVLHAFGLSVAPLALLLDRARWLRTAAVALLAMHLFTSQSWPFAKEKEQPPWDLSRLIPNAVPGMLNVPITAEQARRLEALPVAWELAAGRLAMGLASFAIAWAWGRASGGASPRRTSWALATTVGSLAVVLALAHPRELDDRQLFFHPFREFYTAWLQLDQRAGPEGTRIAYAGTNMPYFLMGVGLRNEVRYVNVDAHRDWLPHDYYREARARGRTTWPDPRPGWDRLWPDYDAWLANLRAEKIRILVVARSNPLEGWHNVSDALGFPIERQWAESHPEAFEPLYGVAEKDKEMRFYRLRR
jgi:hypothetical protein